jgi:PPM family protein phosphatase
LVLCPGFPGHFCNTEWFATRGAIEHNSPWELQSTLLTSFGHSDVGRHRRHNEDSILVRDRLFVVCDGMGGHQAGEVASRLATDVIGGFRHDRSGSESSGPDDRTVTFEASRLKAAICKANAAILDQAQSKTSLYGMGTTVAALVVSEDFKRIEWATVGDSRVYRLRGGVLERLSRDDSWAEMMSQSGSEDAALFGSMKHALTKGLGIGHELDFDVRSDSLQSSDTLLLCSDGLTNMVADDDLRRILVSHAADLEAAGRALIEAANAAGGHDNISAVLVRYDD